MKYITPVASSQTLPNSAIYEQAFTTNRLRALAILVVIGIPFTCKAQRPADPQTTAINPLEILQAAPKVRFNDPEPAPTPQVTPSAPPSRTRPRRTPTPTPTPKPEKRDGLMKGMIRAIPFVGPKMVGPKLTPDAFEPSTHDEQMEEGSDAPATPVGTPRTKLDLNEPIDDVAPQSALPQPPPEDMAPILTVKVAGADQTTATAPASIATPAPIATAPAFTPAPAVKQPAFARAANDDVITTPTAHPTDNTSPTLQASDLGMPNPVYEQNEIIRAEYVEAVKLGRAGNFVEAAKLFYEYAINHPSSGLAPRALFLAAILEPAAERRAEAGKTLRERFPTSRFLSELEKRNRAIAKSLATPTPIPNEAPAQLANRLESELTEAVGSPDREVPLRLKLGQAYLTLEEYDRALEVMRPAIESARGRQEEPEILILISECYIATHRNPQAITLLADVLQRFPAAPQRARALYDYGLVNEASGNFERARAMYSELRQQWPATPEAAQAQQRLRDMDRLTE